MFSSALLSRYLQILISCFSLDPAELRFLIKAREGVKWEAASPSGQDAGGGDRSPKEGRCLGTRAEIQLPQPHGDSLRFVSRFYSWGIWVLLVLVEVTFDYNWKDPFT